MAGISADTTDSPEGERKRDSSGGHIKKINSYYPISIEKFLDTCIRVMNNDLHKLMHFDSIGEHMY